MHVAGRAEIYELKGELGLRATTIERIGLGDHLVALERLKRSLAAEGLFAPERKRRLPRVPRAVGILTGADAAARGDLVATIRARFPATTGSSSARRASRGRAPRRRSWPRSPSSRHVRTSTSSSSRAEAAASRTCSRSATRPSSARSPRPAFPSSRRSGTSRTRRSATSPPTCAPRRRPPQERSSCRTSASSRRRSQRRVGGSASRCARRSSATATGSHGRESACGRRRVLLLERRRAALDRSGARLQTLSPLATLSRGYAIVRAGRRRRCAPRPTSRPATRSTSSSPPARSAHGSRRCAP